MNSTKGYVLRTFCAKRALPVTTLLFLFLFGCISQNSADPLTREERAWLTEHDGKIRLAHDPSAKPFEYLDEAGEFQGIAAGYVRLIENRLKFKFDIVHIKTWDEVLKKAKDKQIDVVCALTKNEDRSQWLLFTDPYIAVPIAIFTKGDTRGKLSLNRMKGMKVTFTKGWIVEDYLRQRYADLIRIPATDADAAMNNLITNKADAWVTALTVAATAIEANRVTNIRVAGETDLSFKLSIASRKDWPILNHILQKGLALIPGNEREEIFKKWIRIKSQSVFKTRAFWIALAVVLAVVLLPVITIYSWNKTLKRRVEEQTEALRRELRERQEVEEELKEATLRQNEAVKAGAIGLWDWDLATNKVHYSSEWKRQIGYADHEISDDFEEWRTRVHPDDLDLTMAKVQKSIDEASQDHKVEFRFRHRDGSYRWILAHASIIRDETGHPIRMVGSHIDMTERKKAEEGLRESEERFRSLYEEAPAGYMEYDTEGCIINVNKKELEMFGYAYEEMVGKYLWDFVVGKDQARKTILGKLSGDIPPSKGLARQYRRKDGTTFPVLIDDFLVKDKDGRIRGIRSINRDITDIKQMEESLSRSLERLDLATHAAGLGVWDWDIQKDELFWDDRMYELFGVKRKDFAGAYEAWLAGVHPDDRAACDEVSRQARLGERDYDTEFRVLWPDGTVRVLRAYGQVVRDSEGKAIRMTGINYDITDRKMEEAERRKLEAQLLRAQKLEAVGTLAGGIAHDFNNILSPILIHTEMALMALPGDSPVRQNLDQVFKAGKRARDLVKQILAFSRQSKSEQTAFNVTPIIKEALKLLRSTIPTTIEIRQNLRAESDLVFADPANFHQILMNLCTNASHAMKDTGGVLEVGLADVNLDAAEASRIHGLRPGAYLRLDVSDTGQGIEPSILQKIFDPFFTTKEVGEGTGMGLSLIHGIVTDLGGAVTAESEPGKGCAFHVYIPIHKEAVPLKPAREIKLPIGNEHILFVDDEEAMVQAIRPMLESLGYTVTACMDSAEAMETFQKNRDKFDLLITDMTMPNMTGDQLAAEVMRLRPGIPVILCTGFSEKIDEYKAKDLGISAFVMKPIVMREIAKTIRDVLNG